jgi:YidC/Oxa1 family membrane protein insertase
MEEVNPYGWRFLRPVLRPIVAGIIWILGFLHDTLHIGYGWVLILFGVLMRVVLWPFNQKAMRAQMRNMQVQPMLKEIQEKYKDQPERLQKEMMRLYKEYGFNPVAGCLPMLLPWPILIALFFVFQNTIELRGVDFLWLPDLSAKDPYYILPVFLAISMFLLQFISYRSMDQDNPQMKMMMWFMPLFMGFIFMRFAAGLNLYYATANIATLPQQFWIAKERVKAKEQGPVKLDGD